VLLLQLLQALVQVSRSGLQAGQLLSQGLHIACTSNTAANA
jgi:hypothetical protein